MSENPPTQNTTKFEVVVKDFYSVMLPGTFPSDPGARRMVQISVSDIIFFWQERLQGSEMLQQAKFEAQQKVPGGHSDCTTVVSDLHRLSPDEILWDDEHLESGGKPMIRLELKKVQW